MRVAQRILILSAAFAVLSTPVASYLTHVPALLRAGESTLQITADRRQTSECSSPRWTAALESRRGIMCRAGQGLFAALVYRPRRAGALGLQAKDDFSLFDRVYDAVGRWLADNPAPLWLVNNPVKRWLATQSAGDYDEAQIRATLERMVAADDIVIISATYCPFSMAAKRVLEAKGVSFQAYEWNKREDGAALVAELGVLTGRTSIPHILVGGLSIGGFNDGTPGLRPLINSQGKGGQGGLDGALAAARSLRATGVAPKLGIFGSASGGQE